MKLLYKYSIMEFNMSWALFESLDLEIQRLELDNYNQYTLTVVVKDDINGLDSNCGIRILALNKNPVIRPITVTLNSYGIVEDDQIID